MYADEFKTLLYERLVERNVPVIERYLVLLEEWNKSLLYLERLLPEKYLNKILYLCKKYEDTLPIKQVAREQYKQLYSFEGMLGKHTCVETHGTAALNYIYQFATQFSEFLQKEDKRVLIISDNFGQLNAKQLLTASQNNDYLIITIRKEHPFPHIPEIDTLFQIMADNAFLVFVCQSITNNLFISHYKHLFDLFISIHNGIIDVKTNKDNYKTRQK